MFRINSEDAFGPTGCPVTFGFARNGKSLPPSIVKQAYFELLGPITSSPSSLLLTLLPGQHVRKAITIGYRADAAGDPPQPKVVGASAPSKNLTADWQSDPQRNVVFVDYTAPDNAGSDRGELVISVSDRGRFYKLKVGYLAMVAGAATPSAGAE
jgi:hypothetical protein